MTRARASRRPSQEQHAALTAHTQRVWVATRAMTEDGAVRERLYVTDKDIIAALRVAHTHDVTIVVQAPTCSTIEVPDPDPAQRGEQSFRCAAAARHDMAAAAAGTSTMPRFAKLLLELDNSALPHQISCA